jgi:hypothetical protein
MNDSRRTASIVAATGAAIAGMEIHNAQELGLPFLLRAENFLPVLIYVVLGAALIRLPGSRIVGGATLAWALMNLVLGGLVSVLPLPIMPWVPEQTVTHYAAHLIYGLSQVPLVVLSFSALRRPLADEEAAV